MSKEKPSGAGQDACPSCLLTDNKPYTDANGVQMRACGRCMIQWRAVQPQPVAAPVVKDVSEQNTSGMCNYPFVAVGSEELEIPPMITDRCELSYGHDGRHKSGNATWGIAQARRPAPRGGEIVTRCNYYFGGFDGGNRCQLPLGHEKEKGHFWQADREPADQPSQPSEVEKLVEKWRRGRKVPGPPNSVGEAARLSCADELATAIQADKERKL